MKIDMILVGAGAVCVAGLYIVYKAASQCYTLLPEIKILGQVVMPERKIGYCPEPDPHGCQKGTHWSEQRQYCIPDTGTCGPNSHYNYDFGNCVCNTGYGSDQAGNCHKADCGPNKHWDMYTVRCQCDDGFVENNGVCEQRCGPNQEYDIGYGGCACKTGYHDNGNGGCDANTTDEENKPPSCSDPNSHFDLFTMKCDCNTGYRSINGVCTLDTTCGSDPNSWWDFYYHACTCKPGYHSDPVTGKCVGDAKPTCNATEKATCEMSYGTWNDSTCTCTYDNDIAW